MRRKKDRSNGITALYERLSRDDDNAGESNSIVHQKQMLEDYAMKHGFTNLVHFTDDGWSGATFDRPSWNRLVEGVKNGEITACICKDMSRIGRDHLQVGFFTDILFREKEVRFIAINNGIDSDRQETSEFAPFLNIMNEWFVRDTSKKIKAVLKSRGSSGNAHTSNIPPYGYLKDPENPDHWIIDEEAVLWSSFFVTLVAKKIVLINLCCRPCFIWGSITIITVWTNMIIINVCKFFYLLIECFLCCKLIQICAFILQGIEVTLHRCIVVRISCFAHALCHIYRFAEFGKCFGRIL